MLNKDENLAKAKSFIEMAEKGYKKGLSMSKKSFSRFDKIRESNELMKNAANHFRLAKDWKNAASAFLKSVEMEKAMNNSVSWTYREAATMQIKYDKLAAVKSLELRAEALCAERQIILAAEAKEQIGKIYEDEKEYLLAAKSYNEAYELYEMTDLIVPVFRFDLLLTVAELKVAAEASKQNITEALRIYENVISQYEEAKQDPEQIYQRAITLHLANNDIDAANDAIQKYVSLNMNWKSREKSPIAFLVKAFQEKDTQKVSDGFWALWKTQWKKPFEDWSTVVLNKIKAHLGKVTMGEAYVSER